MTDSQPTDHQPDNQPAVDQHSVDDGKLREHTFDGIQEFDNRLPRWWLWSFYLACIFSLFYWLHYHGFGTGKGQMQVYNEAVAEAERKAATSSPVTDESLLGMMEKPAILSLGKKAFESNCAQCHLNNGGGSIGPNLTDNAWLHGSKPTDIFETVMKGKIDKGMPPWSMLGKFKCQQIVAYVLTLKNTNVANGKAAEGTVEK